MFRNFLNFLHLSLGRARLKFYQNKLAHEMDSWDVFEALETGEPLIVVDGRTAEAYAQEHISGSISLPHRDLSTTATATLDKSKTYVCYCDGIGCNASTKTALKLLSLGYEVRELIGGLVEARRLRHRRQESTRREGTGLRMLNLARRLRCLLTNPRPV